jgi:hypothetical protein
MGRAAGRKNLPREPGPGTPEGREIGESERQDPSGSPIPGLTGNIANYETVRRPVPVGDPLPEHRGMMAHGVPPDGDQTTGERAAMEREGTLAQHRPPRPPELARTAPRPVPVPVYLVEEQGGGDVYLTASPRNISVPVIGTADPARLCGRNPRRNRILLLNESTSTNIRVGHLVGDVSTGGGGLLPSSATSYLPLETQDELFALAVAGGSACTVSIIEEFEQEL